MNSSATSTARDALPVEPPPAQLKRDLRKAQVRKRTVALALIAPLTIFLLITFVAPIAILLKRAIENPEVANALPRTVAALAGWDRKSTPPDSAYVALADDLTIAKIENTVGALARRVNTEIPGARSGVAKTGRPMPPPR